MYIRKINLHNSNLHLIFAEQSTENHTLKSTANMSMSTRAESAAVTFGQTLVRSHIDKWGYDLVIHEGVSFPAWAVIMHDTYVISVDEAEVLAKVCKKFNVHACIVREEHGFRVIFS